MYTRMLVIACISLISLTQAGCVGLIISAPEECKNETPSTVVHDFFWKPASPKKKLPLGLVIPEVPAPKASTKAEFLKDWGEPDEIVSNSENEETWVYYRKLWCGIMPVVILPVPLILPVCDGFDRIEFKGSDATRLHTRRIVMGTLLINGPRGTDPACRYPLPDWQ